MVERRRETIQVMAESGWHLAYREQRFGPYPTQAEALATAESWAENARQQGHEVQVVIDGGSGSGQLSVA